jgi:hypothetical protein
VWAAAAGVALGAAAAAAAAVAVGLVDAVLFWTLVAAAGGLTGAARAAMACERKILAAWFARAIASDAAAVSGVAVVNRRAPAAAAGATGAAVVEAVAIGKRGLSGCGGGTCAAMGLAAPLACAWSIRCLRSGVALDRCDRAPTHPRQLRPSVIELLMMKCN